LITRSRSNLCRTWSTSVVVDETAAEDIPKVEAKTLADIIAGGEYQGVVTNVVSYGVFVDIGVDVNGLVHISQISDSFIASPEEIVSVGDVVSVKVLSTDTDTKKLELSMRHNPRTLVPFQTEDLSPYVASLAEDPARLIDGTVEHIIKHGAFLKLVDGGYGFLHISQMRSGDERVSDVKDVLSNGQSVQVRLLNVDKPRKRMNLSLLPISDSTGKKPSKDVSNLVNIDRNVLLSGTIASVHEYGVFVTVNGVDGLLHTSKIEERKKFTLDELNERFKVGETLEVRILHVDTVANKLSLTILPYPAEPDLTRFLTISNDEWIEGTVVSTVAYGAFVQLGDGIDGMIHISELGDKRLGKVTDAVNIGDIVRVRVIDVQPEQRKVRLSMRDPNVSVPSNQLKKSKNVEKFVGLSPNEWIDGKVQSFTEFGAFIRLDKKTDGLLHLSQMNSQNRVDRAEDVLSLDQEVKVRVINVDPEAGRISLSMKEPQAISESNEQRQQSGSRRRSRDVTPFIGTDPNTYVTGKVTSLLPYGCFVELENSNGLQGLLHISQLSEDRINSVEDVLKEGDIISIRIIDVDIDAGKISLSMLSPGSAKNTQRAERNNGSENDFNDGSDDDVGGGRKKSPRPRFNDLTYLDNNDSTAGEKDWHKYLNNYFDKKE
jgi:small subunit ribosomal protein S1